MMSYGGMSPSEFDLRIRRLYNEAVRDRHRLREAARRVIGVFMADAALDDPDGKWDAAINELEAAAGLQQQEGS